ncbi:hypothetical protein RDV89_06095 [Nocardioides zeae]|uniref:Helix-turn-helix domain-containing protein n=1 Tax=Nocardioides imazamoxiresistens TaxID=3231893 RepID=A0ABU3PTR7_9ACTN|nr:hypothetical protein [Nocardioides zeae]MDT9592627.1 hypothetical protein [Nocardioides zeae]
MDLMTVAAAARALDVSTRQVQHLVEAGELRRLERGIVDRESVERLVATRGGSHSRGWSEQTAWGAVALLTGATADWMGESQRSRLRGRLRTITSSELAERTRRRASVARYAAHSSVAADLTARLVSTGDAAGRLGLTATAAVDGYLGRSELAEVVRDHGLVRDDAGSVTLRATDADLAVVQRLASSGTTLAALDLASSSRARERRAGLDGLDRALRAFRG